MVADDLDGYLAALEWGQRVRVERVLKETPAETTELVWCQDASGQDTGPYIRKTFSAATSLGVAYDALFQAQRQGRVFHHLPRIINAYDDGRSSVYVLEYAPGENLDAYVKRHHPSMALAGCLFPQLCDGVIELHEGFSPPIIHRDLKPANIIVGVPMPATLTLTIIDFGIARRYREGTSADTTHFGTRAFAPPEQYGFGQTDVRSDVYALGCVLAFMLSGTVPELDALATTLRAVGVSPALTDVVLTACTFDPDRRYQSVRALKAAFLAALGGVREGTEARSSAAWGSVAQGSATSDLAGRVSATSDLVDQSSMTRSPVTSDPLVQNAAARPAAASVKVSEIFGLIWDGLLVGGWLLIFAACFSCTFAPSEMIASYTPLYRVIAYFGFVLFGVSGLSYVLFDTRFLRRKLRWLARQTIKRRLVIAAILVAVALGFLMVCSVLNALGIAQG